MKKKILSLLLLLLCVGSNTTHAIPSAIAAEKPTALAAEEKSSIADTYEPLIQNYPLLTIAWLKQDWLHKHKGNNEDFQVKKFHLGLSRWVGRGCSLLYAFRINRSRFAICPGIGYSALKYAFSKKKDKNSEDNRYYQTLRKTKGDTVCSKITEEDLGGEDWAVEPDKVTDSTFQVSYFDLLIRMRFNSVLDEPNDGFHIWLGGKLGFCIDASTTIAYHAHDKSNSLVRTSDFDLKRCVFGLQGGIGYWRVGLEGGYTFFPLFREKQLRNGSNTVIHAMHPFSLALYVDLF